MKPLGQILLASISFNPNALNSSVFSSGAKDWFLLVYVYLKFWRIP